MPYASIPALLLSSERTLINEFVVLLVFPTITFPLKVDIPAVKTSISAFWESIDVDTIESAVIPPDTLAPEFTSIKVLKVEIPLLATIPPEFTKNPPLEFNLDTNVDIPETNKEGIFVDPRKSILTVEIPLVESNTCFKSKVEELILIAVDILNAPPLVVIPSALVGIDPPVAMAPNCSHTLFVV